MRKASPLMRLLDRFRPSQTLAVPDGCSASDCDEVLSDSPAVPRRPFGMIMVYYGRHSKAVDARILEARPAYLVANTTHGLWAEVNGHQTDGLLQDVRILQEAGTRVLGYLTSGYGAKGSSSALGSQWCTLEGNQRLVGNMASLDGVDGVFIDECSAHPDDDEKEYYQQLARLALSHGLAVWGNAGQSDFDPWYFTCGGFDFMNSTERWDGQQLTAHQRQWCQRMSVVALGPNHSLDEALRLTAAACRQGLAYCCVTTSYLRLPPWTEHLAEHFRRMDWHSC